MKIAPKEFNKDSIKEAVISEENFDGGDYEVWFEFPKPEDKEEKVSKKNRNNDSDEEIDYRDYLIHVEVGEVYTERMDVNVDVKRKAVTGCRDLHVRNLNGEDEFVLKKAAEILD